MSDVFIKTFDKKKKVMEYRSKPNINWSITSYYVE